MNNILQDLISFIQSLSIIDLFFFGSILVLMILIVVLIYIIRLNNDGEDMDEVNILDDEEIANQDTNVNLETSSNKASTSDELNLKAIADAIEEEEPQPIILNNYEKEQEAKAIISYDELIAKKSEPEEINYKNEEDLEGLTVKSLDMENLTKPIDLPKMKEPQPENISPINKSSMLISYDKEEAFLEALKNLQSLLN